jgi:hypothetical protein
MIRPELLCANHISPRTPAASSQLAGAQKLSYVSNFGKGETTRRLSD